MKNIEEFLTPIALAVILLLIGFGEGCVNENEWMPTENQPAAEENLLAKTNFLFSLEERRDGSLNNKLDLTDEQINSIGQIIINHLRDMKSELNGNFFNLPKEERKKFIAQKIVELKYNIKKQLTDSQIEKIEKFRKDHYDDWNKIKEELFAYRHNMLERLNLSESQKNEIKTKVKENVTSRQNEIVNTRFEDIHEWNAWRSDKREVLLTELSKILTDEQKQIISEYKEKMYEKLKEYKLN